MSDTPAPAPEAEIKRVWVWTEFTSTYRPKIEEYELVSSNPHGVVVKLYGSTKRIRKALERTFLFDRDAVVEKYRKWLAAKVASAGRKLAELGGDMAKPESGLEIHIKPAVDIRPKPGELKLGPPYDGPDIRLSGQDPPP